MMSALSIVVMVMNGYRGTSVVVGDGSNSVVPQPTRDLFVRKPPQYQTLTRDLNTRGCFHGNINVSCII